MSIAKIMRVLVMGETSVPGKKIDQILLYPPQIPHWLAWNRARSSTVKSLWLTF
jgi:hypothetical protein